MNTKKHLIILILKILETETDFLKPLTQTKIAAIVSENYPCDRKTVGRNIEALIHIGYPIIKTSRGVYLNGKRFTVTESKFILDAVRNAPSQNKALKESIFNRLSETLNKIYR